MSKPLEEMTVDELRHYMREHRDNDEEWERAYDLFHEKADWQKPPKFNSAEEEEKFIEDLIASKTKK